MSSATMSILGLYKWGLSEDDDLFKNLSLPRGIDKAEVVDNILVQCAEFELLYTDFEFCQFSIGLWSKRWYRTFDKWYKALQIEYDPLNNYDRIEEWTEDETGTRTTTDSGSANSTDSASSVSDDYVTAYNSDTLRQERQNKSSSSGEQSTISSNEENENTKTNNIRKGRAYGNIGVTTSQQMLESELDISRFNLIQQIVDCFKTEFCILVY